jgi:hypothetical protein
MSPCKFTQFIYIWKLLYMFLVIPPPAHRTVSTASGTLHVSGGTSTHHQERTELYLQHLVFVTPLLQPAAIMEELELLHVAVTV